MNTEVSAVDVEVTSERLRAHLSDGRIVETAYGDVPWLRWLRDASEESRSVWSLEPGGFAIFWEALDDGVEVRHLLSLTPIK